MDNSKKDYVLRLLNNENTKEIIKEINAIQDSEILHMFAGNYNWDNGFDIPYSIINNKNCDLGTALMIFYDADGYRVLENRDELVTTNLKEWAIFMQSLEKKILEKKFTKNIIKFVPPLTKVQIFKLKKNNPKINDIFIEESEGIFVDVPNM